MVRIGQVVKTTIWPPLNYTSGKTQPGVRLILVSFGGFQKWVQFIPQAGEDVIPPVGSIITMVESHELIMGTSTFDNVHPDPHMNTGEKELYSSDGSGNKLARHKMKQNGKHYIANATQDLRTQLDNLLVALNTFCGSAAQSAITAGGSSSAALAAAIVALMQPLFTSVTNVQTALDALLDNAP